MSGGQSFTSAQGSFGASVTLALLGIAITSAQGLVTANVDGTVALVGQSAIVEAGTASPEYSRDITGTEIQLADGSLGVLNLQPALTSDAIVSASGTLSAQGTDVNANLSGVEATFASGLVAGVQSLSGSVSTSASGTVLLDRDIPLSGLSAESQIGTISAGQGADDSFITSSHGNVTYSLAVALIGSEATGEQGSFTVTGDSFAALTGEEVTSAAGTITHTESFALAGQEATLAQQSMGAPGGAALTGSEISSQAGTLFTTNDREQALSGQEVIAQTGTTFASSLAFPPGNSIVVSQQSIGPRSQSLTGISVQVGQGFVSVPVSVPVVPVVASGGFVRRYRSYRSPTEEETRRERERLGILPSKQREAVKAVVERLSEKPETYDAAVDFAERITDQKGTIDIKKEIRKELDESHARVKDDLIYITKTLILDALQERFEAERKQREEDEISKIFSVWLRM